MEKIVYLSDEEIMLIIKAFSFFDCGASTQEKVYCLGIKLDEALNRKPMSLNKPDFGIGC